MMYDILEAHILDHILQDSVGHHISKNIEDDTELFKLITSVLSIEAKVLVTNNNSKVALITDFIE